MSECFSDRAKVVMALANQEAQRFNHEYIGTEHILLGLVKEGGGVGAKALKSLKIDLQRIRLAVEKLVRHGSYMVMTSRLSLTPLAKKALEFATEEARTFDCRYIGTGHLLLGLLREREGLAAKVLVDLGVELKQVREEVLEQPGLAASSPVLTVKRYRVRLDPDADVFRVEFNDDKGWTWKETIVTQESVRLFIRGVQAGCGSCGVKIPMPEIPREAEPLSSLPWPQD